MKSVPISDACALVTDGTHYTPPSCLDGIPFLTVKHMGADYLDFASATRISAAEYARAQAGNSTPVDGDVLFSKDGTVGKVHVVSEAQPFAVLSSIAILRPEPNLLDSGYLGHVLRAPSLLSRALWSQTGTAIRRIILADLQRLMIPLPPLEEQRRVARMLDRAIGLCGKRRNALGQIETLAESMFTEMFGRDEANRHDWPSVRLGDVATTTSGGTPSRREKGNFGGSIPWVKSGELHEGVVLRTEECITPAGLASSSAKLMPKGTLLMAMYGATAGAVATLGIEAATNQAICCIEVGDTIHPDYLGTFLRTITLRLLQRRVGGAQPNLSQGMIRDLVLPLPPMALQNDFSVRLATLTPLFAAQRAHQAELETLFATLQSQAFDGAL